MRIGEFFPSVEHEPRDDMVTRVAMVDAAGFLSAWLPQRSSLDALTILAVIGRQRADDIPCGSAADRARTIDQPANPAAHG